jgi:hypothetical protein
MDANYVPIRNRDNDYRIDRAQQRQWSYTGIAGISEQDAAIADSQGLIADRTRELLGQTDLGIVRFRQMMLAAVKDQAEGRTPRGVNAANAYQLRSGDVVAPGGTKIADALDARFCDQWGVGANRS